MITAGSVRGKLLAPAGPTDPQVTALAGVGGAAADTAEEVIPVPVHHSPGVGEKGCLTAFQKGRGPPQVP